jgi:hypothetical protein
MKIQPSMTSFTMQDVVAGLEAKVEELITIVLAGQGFKPVQWAHEVLEDETDVDDDVA